MADKSVQQNSKLEVRAHARNLRISPRKLRLVTNSVKNMRATDALVQLQFTNKKAAEMVSKVIQSAMANAVNNFSLNRDGLFIKSITCDMGAVMKRAFPRARGSAFVIRHKLAHVNVVLEERAVKAPATKKADNKKKTEKADHSKSTKTGVPEMKARKVSNKKVVKEAHHENEAAKVEEKTQPENLVK